MKTADTSSGVAVDDVTMPYRYDDIETFKISRLEHYTSAAFEILRLPSCPTRRMNCEATSKSTNHLNGPARSLTAVQLKTDGNVSLQTCREMQFYNNNCLDFLNSF